ncbi:MAG: MBL fold metallo-hydrolase [Chloroflexi bacterium]|nr:MBL fold metallo-hydrolase [Chloroflexota bacterium]
MTDRYEGELWTIHSFVSGFENNAYLLKCKRSNKGVIIDTPDNPVELLLAARDTEVEAVLITHNHWDHLEGFEDVLVATNAPVGIGAADAGALPVKPQSTLDVSHGNLLQIGDIALRCIATPGHTAGSTCFILPSEHPGATPHVFTGDTLFPGGPGKSGSAAAFRQLVHRIESQLLTLPESTVVLPGHGAQTTIRESQLEFEVFSGNPHRADLFGDVTWTGDNS